MPIEVELPDGSIAEFPDGTDNATMERALSSYAAPKPKATTQPPKPKRGPDFSNVQSRTIGSTESTRESARTRRIRAQSEGEAYRAKLEAQRMEDGPGFFAGMGYSFDQTMQGAKQFANDALGVNANSAASATDSVGLTGLSKLMRENVALPAYERGQRYQQQTADMRQDMEPMQGSIASQAGNITGTAAQFMGPGFLARGTAAAPIIVPRAVGGNALQGLLLGGVQPVESQGERVGNAAIGAAAGGGLAGLIKGGGMVRNWWSNPLTSAERSAGGAIKEVLGGKPLGYTPSSVPGVRRTLGEGTLNPEIMSLERNSRRMFPQDFAELDMQNNLQRVKAIESFAGDEAKVAAAKASRNAAATPLLATAKKVEGVDTSRLVSQVRRIENAQQGRPAVQGALKQVRDLLTRQVPDAERISAAVKPLQDFVQNSRGSATNREAAKEAIKQIRNGEWPSAQFKKGGPGTVGVGKTYDDAKSALDQARKALGKEGVGRDKLTELYNVRKTIDDMLSGKFGGDSSAALQGSRELMAVKGQLDRVLAKASPEFAQYLQAYKTGSKPINRMEIGQQLMGQKSGSAILDPQTGVQQLTPAQFSRQARNLDKVAQQATGFRKAKAADSMLPEDVRAVNAVKDDLERQVRRAQNPAQPGSATMEAGELLKKTAIRSLAARSGLPVISGIADLLEGRATAQANQTRAYLIANPAEAQRVLAALDAPKRELVRRALVSFGSKAWVVDDKRGDSNVSR